MVFQNDLESVFPESYYRFLPAKRLTALCDSFHVVSGNELDVIRKDTLEGNVVIAARLKSDAGETIFFTAHTAYSDLLHLVNNDVEAAA